MSCPKSLQVGDFERRRMIPTLSPHVPRWVILLLLEYISYLLSRRFMTGEVSAVHESLRPKFFRSLPQDSQFGIRARENSFRMHKNLLSPRSFKRFLECIATFALVFNSWSLRRGGSTVVRHPEVHIYCTTGAHAVLLLKWFTLSFELFKIHPLPRIHLPDHNLATITYFHRKKINVPLESSAFYFDLFFCSPYSFFYTFSDANK